MDLTIFWVLIGQLRSDLQAVCGKACLKKQGNMSDMKNRLVYNFLKHATAEQIINAESTEIWAVSEKPAVDKAILQNHECGGSPFLSSNK